MPSLPRAPLIRAASVVSLIACCVLVSVASAGPPMTTIVPVDQAQAQLANLGIHIPPQSCLAQPTRPDCPPVSVVVISMQREPGADSSEYGPTASPARSGPQPEYGEADACALFASDPGVYTTAQSTLQNTCRSGVGVSHMELWGNLLRWNETDGRWYTLNNCYKSKSGSGTQSCTSVYDCYHPSTLRLYMGEAQGYVVNGVGYFGVDDSNAIGAYCY